MTYVIRDEIGEHLGTKCKYCASRWFAISVHASYAAMQKAKSKPKKTRRHK